MATRKRKANWTKDECLLLAESVLERKDVIRGKSRTRVSLQERKQSWEEIVQTINVAFPEIQHTVSACNKKWENLVTKAREEIKQQRNRNEDEAVSLEQLSAVTQIVISVMNLSDMLLQGTWTNKSGSEGDHKTNEKAPNKHLLTEPCGSRVAHKQTLRGPSASLHAAVLTDSGEHLDAPCSTSQQSGLSRTLQERMDLEMSVLRRQEAVLNLQEEYYTLKIRMMRNQMRQAIEKE